ncbi:MAG: flagellar basal body L-ring protein FlgH [Pseudomonadota bacterium]
MGKIRIYFFLLGAMVVAGLTGCATSSSPSPAGALAVNRPLSPPIPVQLQIPPSEGSLWSETASHLFVDPKAKRIGDTVTVDIVENTSSKLDANTSASRASDIDVGVDSLMGYMRALEAKNPNLNRDNKGALNNTLIKAHMANNFDGKGSSDRSGRVTASIGARVAEVLPNGNLVIVGHREMKVNKETQYIAVSGIVRPKDIDADNRVKSTYLADARIEYYGQGTLGDKQQPGWLSRALDRVWPF